MPATKSVKRKSLTAAFVTSVMRSGKYHDGRGTGLFLLVKNTGAKPWVQRIVILGKRREIGLGAPPIVTLAEARELALENKRVATTGFQVSTVVLHDHTARETGHDRHRICRCSNFAGNHRHFQASIRGADRRAWQ